MNFRNFGTYRARLAFVFTLAVLSVGACQYSVPITERPTRNVEMKLIGNWVSANGRETIKIRTLTQSTYIVSYNNVLFQAFHSDLSGISFLTVQELETRNRSYTYLTYRLSEDGAKLYLRLVNEEVVPRETKDVTTIQQLLKRNLQNPALLRNEDEFTKVR
jgi:hypothetical protein